MKKIIAFSGSNSDHSINQQLVDYSATLIEGVEVLNLKTEDFPMYDIDREKELGIPQSILDLMKKIMEADGVIISAPEHNGLMPAFFKSILDWLSRTKVMYMENTPLLLMSVSPGKNGAKRSAQEVERILGFAKANVIARFSLPRFGDNFDQKSKSISNKELRNELQEKLELLLKA